MKIIMVKKHKLIINYVFILLISIIMSVYFFEFSKNDYDIVLDFYKNKKSTFNLIPLEKILFWKNMKSIFIFANVLFIFTLFENSINNIDLSWGLMIFYLLFFNFFILKSPFLEVLNLSFDEIFEQKLNLTLIILFPVVLFSIKHLFFVLRSFKGFEKEHIDFRYSQFSNETFDKYEKVKKWLLIYINFHFMNCFIIGLVVYPIIEVIFYSNFGLIQKENYFILFYFSFYISLISILIETISDEDLYKFRLKNNKKDNQEKSKVIFIRFWRFSRHPNYLGEIVFYWTLIFINFSLKRKFEITNCIGAFIMTCIFLTYSIPVMENHMKDKYTDEYDEYLKKVPYKIIPYLY